MVKTKLKVSKIVNPLSAIPALKRVKIYELAQQKEFQHPEFVWKRVPVSSLNNRCNINGRKKKTINYTKKKILSKSKRAGKPMYSKIGRYLDISEQTVRFYLTGGHQKHRDRYKNDKVYHDKCRSYWKIDREKILKNLSKRYKIKKEYYENVDDDEKLIRMLELSGKLLYDPIAGKDTRKKKHVCFKCGKLLSRNSSSSRLKRSKDKRYFFLNKMKKNYCGRCLMSEIGKIRMDKNEK